MGIFCYLFGGSYTDPEYAQVIYYPGDIADLKRYDVQKVIYSKCAAVYRDFIEADPRDRPHLIRFHRQLSLPCCDAYRAYIEFWHFNQSCPRWLGDFSTPKPKAMILLNIDSDSQLGFCFSGDGLAQVLITQEQLIHHDFAHLAVVIEGS